MSEPQPTAATVVIPVHTEGRLPGLRVAIASVLDQDLEVAALVVVVDHHESLLQSLRVEFAGHERVQVVPNGYAPGASGARNAGADLAQTPVLAFLDSDAVAQPSWLRALIAPLKHDQVVGTGGRVVPRWAPARPKWFPDEFGWVVGVDYRGQRASPGAVRNVWSENMAVRTDSFRAVGGFRVSFGKVGGVSRPEDTDLCVRMSLASAGGTWIYVPDAVVEHDVGQMRSQFSFFLARSYNEGRGKVELARLNRGRKDLQPERDWLLRTLPFGLAHYGAASVRDPQQLLRAGAALLGATAAGLGAARALAAPIAVESMPAVSTSAASRPHLISVMEMTAPCLRLDVDISEELPSVPGGRSHCAWILVRALGNPVGAAVVAVPDQGLTSAELGALLQSALGDELSRLLRADGILEPGTALTLPLTLAAVVPRGNSQRLAPAPAPAMTVVVCTAHRGDGLRLCLASLSRLKYPDFSILVLDNQPVGSEVARLVEEIAAQGLSIRLVAEPRRGLSWARNRALAEVDSEWTAWIDDDETADPHWLTAMAWALAETPGAAAVAGVMVPAELETPAQVLFEQYGGHSKHRGFHPVIFSPGHPQSPLYPLPPFGTGGNMALRRSALRQVGGFDTALGAGTLTRAGEDTKMFTDLLLAGETVVYQPRAVTYHTHRRTMDELAAQVMGYGSGLTAYYTAELLGRPALAFSLGKLAPKFIREATSPSNLRTASLPAQFPSRLLWANRTGLVSGPGRYLLARAIARRVGHRHARRIRG